MSFHVSTKVEHQDLHLTEVEKSYLTDFLQALIAEGCNLKAIPINGGWLELDSINDYDLYKKMYDSCELSKLITI